MPDISARSVVVDLVSAILAGIQAGVCSPWPIQDRPLRVGGDWAGAEGAERAYGFQVFSKTRIQFW